MKKSISRGRKLPVIVLSALALCLLLGAGIGLAVAYLTDTDDASNAFTVSMIGIRTDEDYTDPGPLTPGQTFTKDVRFTNIDTGTAYVRALVSFSDKAAEDNLRAAFNTTDWTDVQDDGYRYLKAVLPVGATTPSLMTSVTVTGTPDGGWSPFDIYVYAEAVQVTDSATGQRYADAQTAFAAYERGA